MKRCCPPARGCNSPQREPCVLELCRQAAAEEPAAALAVARWEAWQHPGGGAEQGRGGRRFRRRAYERARDAALVGLLMRAREATQPPLTGSARPVTRLGVLVGQHPGQRPQLSASSRRSPKARQP